MMAGEDTDKAGDRNPGQAKPWWKAFRIPYAVALLGVVIATAAAVSIPLGVLAFSGASKSTDSMTNALRSRVVTTVSRDVLQLSQKCFDAVNDIRTLASVNNYFAAYSADKTLKITAEPYLSSLVGDLINIAKRHSLTTAFNVAARLPDVGPGENLLVGHGITIPGVPNGAWVRVGEPWASLISYNPSYTTTPSKSQELFPASETGMWLPTTIFEYAGIYSPTKICYIAPSFIDRTPPASPADPRMGNYTSMFSGVMPLDYIQQYLQTVAPTANSAVAVFDRADGALVGASKPGLTLTPANDAIMNVMTINDTLLRESANGLYVQLNGGWGAVPLSGPAQATIKTSEGAILVSATAIKSDKPGLDWILLIAIPEDDLIGAMKKARKAAIIAVSVIAASMVLIAAVVRYLFVIPLKRLSLVMQAATKFDFSAVNSGSLNRRSILAELANMEEVFATMLHKFATAIQANKSLQNTRTHPASVQPEKIPTAASPLLSDGNEF
ncbi:hypothetical protein DFJ77DRAFT_520437 [Powellomyces hirtus]|nr:hypothetical protein DFJ77DRAFT_520437 [Powellomyces hirtus]